MLHQILARIQGATIANPWRVLAGTLAAVALALALGSQVEFRTSRSDLTPPDDPDQQRFDKFLKDSGGSSYLIACVEVAEGRTRTPDELRAFADALAEEIRRDPLVASVFYRFSLPWFLEHGFHLAPPAWIRQAVAAARVEKESFDRMPGLRDLADVNDVLAARLEKGLTEASSAPNEEEPAEGIDQLTTFLRLERRFLDDPAGGVAALQAVPPLVSLAGDRPEIASRGYLTTY